MRPRPAGPVPRRGAPRGRAPRSPRRRPARTTDPVIASSSVGRPAAASRAAEVVRSCGNPSMIAHCPAGSSGTPSAAATAHASASADSRRGRQAASARSAPTGSPEATVAAARTARRAAFSQSTRALVTGHHDLDPGNAERRERRLEGLAFEIARGRRDHRVAGRPLDDEPRLRRVGLDAPDAPRRDRDRCRRRAARREARADRVDVLETVEEGRTTAPSRTPGGDAVEGRLEVVGLDRDDEERHRPFEPVDRLRM